MRSPVTYFGGKSGMAQRLIGLMPPHRVYIEPFFGSGAVFFAKRPVEHEIVNDLDGAVVAFFRCLRERPDELEHVCRLTPYAREEYEAADPDEPGLDDLEMARRWWVKVNQSFGKTAGRATGWSVTVARTQSTASTTWSRIGRFAAAAERLMHTSIECRPAVDVIDRLAVSPDTLVYADPPYLAAQRQHRKAGSTCDYRVEMAHEDQHTELARALHETPATVILSGYPSPLYEDLFGDWWSIDFHVTAHSSNAATHGRGARIERVWSNRDLHEGRLIFDAGAEEADRA